ncbi:MAG: TlpA family protein disulfide reductase [Candidatus Villigracilaceae bacterium]
MLLLGIYAAFALTGSDQSEPAQPTGPIPVSVNYPAPDLTLDTLQGKDAALKDYLGQVVLVNLWATWCPPCKAEMPTLQAYYQAHKAQGFILIAVNAGDSASEVQMFVDKLGLTFPIWLDPNHAALRAFRTTGLPSSFVIDRDGQVRLAWSGAVERQTLEKYVTPLLGR